MLEKWRCAETTAPSSLSNSADYRLLGKPHAVTIQVASSQSEAAFESCAYAG